MNGLAILQSIANLIGISLVFDRPVINGSAIVTSDLLENINQIVASSQRML